MAKIQFHPIFKRQSFFFYLQEKNGKQKLDTCLLQCTFFFETYAKRNEIYIHLNNFFPR